MRKLAFSFVLLLMLVPSPVLSQECNWLQMGIQGFSLRADESSCQRLFEWQAFLEENERGVLQDVQLYRNPHYELLVSGMIVKMQRAVEKRYGPQPEYEVHLVDDASINVFASGAQVFVNGGTLLFYLEPRGFWIAQGANAAQAERLWSEVTPWENDVGGLAFILAHEVAHNVLQHPPNVVGFICNQHLDHVEQLQARAERREERNRELEEEGKKVGFCRNRRRTGSGS